MPTSFRKSPQSIPSQYRTPSPPRDAFEPLSPAAAGRTTIRSLDLQWADKRNVHNELKRPCSVQSEEINGPHNLANASRGAMDAFASIALTAVPNNSQKSNIPTSSQYIGSHDDRPLKRAKSEKSDSSNCLGGNEGTDVRPATSYEQPPDDRRLEAELLLNFAQANFAQAITQITSPSSTDSQGTPIYTHAAAKMTIKATTSEDNLDYQISDGQQHSVGESQERFGTMTAKSAERLSAAEVLMDDRSLQEESSYGQDRVRSGSIAVETANRCMDRSETHGFERETITSEFSEHDDVDLIPEPLSSEQVAAAGQKEIPKRSGNRGTSNDLNPNLVSGSQDAVGSEWQNVAGVHNSPARDNELQQEEDDAEFKGKAIGNFAAPGMRQFPRKDVGNGFTISHRALSYSKFAASGESEAPEQDTTPLTPKTNTHLGNDSDGSTSDDQSFPTMTTAICAACKFVRNSKGVDTDNDSTSWISCDACKSWFHFACAGFRSEREVRGVDKFRCRHCKPIHGSTTYVRKSSRAHSAIDYAGLHQGVIKTSDERPEHHYIKPIKEGTMTFLPEAFARMRPDLVTAEYFEKGAGMKEPIVIPVCLNPRRDSVVLSIRNGSQGEDESLRLTAEVEGTAEDWFSRQPEWEHVPDHGQDALDMVIPQELTVRQVAELYGPEEKVEVIDVKSQNGENKKWNMRRWADYYENPSNKVVRNVISLEVSQSKLGRLIKRPQVVRDLDLQDSVWPEDLLAKGEFPRVQFYCLMSVADCFTDFHIDFGGSSVFYHILKGKKTFLFIPPKEKHLKKYEEWCMSPAQNWTFLGDQTKECYRVDLSEGDTMLIPSGWIHAVWTPEDSLVIGGNFLTRMNFGMQLRVAQLEKATGVARKFRYPHFQKLHWYTALQYLEKDPLPGDVRNLLQAGGSFHREMPAHHDFDAWGGNSRAGLENYHARYYSQPELEGLPDLVRYLLRTALIDIGSITDGISADTRNAVKKSIPRGHGEPLDIIKTFAAWCAWKRGNEPIPHWAYPDVIPEDLSPVKLSAAAMKKLNREASLSAPRRQSARMQHQQELLDKVTSDSQVQSTASNLLLSDAAKRLYTDISPQMQTGSAFADSSKKPKVISGTSFGSHRKTACDSCRKRRRACKHKDQVAASMSSPASQVAATGSTGLQVNLANRTAPPDTEINVMRSQSYTKESDRELSRTNDEAMAINHELSISQYLNQSNLNGLTHSRTDLDASANTSAQQTIPAVPKLDLRMSGDAIRGLEPSLVNPLQARPRHKACNECRKSKVGTTAKSWIAIWLTELVAPLHS